MHTTSRTHTQTMRSRWRIESEIQWKQSVFALALRLKRQNVPLHMFCFCVVPASERENVVCLSWHETFTICQPFVSMEWKERAHIETRRKQLTRDKKYMFKLVEDRQLYTFVTPINTQWSAIAKFFAPMSSWLWELSWECVCKMSPESNLVAGAILFATTKSPVL